MDMMPCRRVQVSSPVDRTQMVPPPYRNASGKPVQHQFYDLDRETILTALDAMASYLKQKGVSVNAITVGGAVNTVYLGSRKNTHDVDFFLANPRAPEHAAIHEAARYANRQAGGALGAEWFNNSTQIMMGETIQRGLAESALQQGVIVYNQVDRYGGLRVYAAPWSYALCGKINRLCEGNARPYDIADAVAYLSRYLQATGCTSVEAARVSEWCTRYRKNFSQSVLRAVDEAYVKQYQRRGIKW